MHEDEYFLRSELKRKLGREPTPEEFFESLAPPNPVIGILCVMVVMWVLTHLAYHDDEYSRQFFRRWSLYYVSLGTIVMLLTRKHASTKLLNKTVLEDGATKVMVCPAYFFDCFFDIIFWPFIAGPLVKDFLEYCERITFYFTISPKKPPGPPRE